MQFNLVNKKERPVFHNGALCLGVSSFIRTCTASSRSHSLSVVVMLGECCVAFVLWWFSAFFLFFCFPLSTPPFFPLLSQCDGCPDVSAWGLISGLQGLLAMGAFYRLGAGWSQWRPLDNSGTHLPLSLMQLLTKNIENIQGTAHDFNFSKCNIFKYPCWKNLIQHNTSCWCSNLGCGKSKTLWKNNTMEIMMITKITNKKGQEKNNQKVIHLILDQI